MWTHKYLLILFPKLIKRKFKYKLHKNMPQLIPFYFLNQLSFLFFTLIVLIYIFSKYILPSYTLQQVIRLYIKKLNNKI